MKRIISKRDFQGVKLLLLWGMVVCATLMASCGGEKKEVPRTQEQILDLVEVVQAVGKVVPADDFTLVTAEISGKITDILVKEGDTVQQGQTLIVLSSGNADLDVEEARAKLFTLTADRQSTLYDLEKAKLVEQELRTVYETTQRLVVKSAETKEREQSDFSNWQQQKQVVAALQAKVKAQEASEKEQQLRLTRTQRDLGNYEIKAARSGLLTEFDAKVGQVANSNQVLAKIVQTSAIQIEAEVDELFANDVQKGMKVAILANGRMDTLATGSVVYTSPILSNKSILYETANEAQDRRVLRIKVQVEDGVPLTINSKVNVQIKIK